ncbi:hypothetical protein JCM19237_3170 [Photobacterium aphoticum]|uniref:Uncharacterized protein n=1 Tax=Photobacterium aphoticum TaxID=754436 RepID=A0A090R0K9_9GAMM|nr:hypothetical protein JCM19237_3170 [Photobacterium aphoticum]
MLYSLFVRNIQISSINSHQHSFASQLLNKQTTYLTITTCNKYFKHQ